MSSHDFFSNQGWELAGDLSLPARAPRFADPSGLPLASAPAAFVQQRHPDGLYEHQATALEAALGGQNVCIATGTSSGKSLVFQTTALQRLAEDSAARVLAIYPQKALGSEQEERWRAALAEAGISGKVVRIDGSVRRKERLDLLRGARIAVMTPDIIHAWLMTSVSYASAQKFLGNLKLVVVDEIHTYTGVFGSNAAFLFRRLQHLLAFFPARPQWIAASATLANAESLLQGLFGLRFEVIGPGEDSSGRQPVQIEFVRPPAGKDFLSSVASLLDALARSKERRFIAFVDSRKQTEQITAILARGDGFRDDSEDQEDLDEDLADHLQRLDVLPYRAGYEAADRSIIQRRLSDGTLPGVVSTSALELGIDIPFLDTAVLVGVPRSSTSLHQRIGRIGRRGPGRVIVISSGDLYDEAIFAKPEEMLQRPHTDPALYLENRYIQYIHALCLARSGGEHDTMVSLLGGNGDRPFASSVQWPDGFIELCDAERVGEIPADLQSMKVDAGEGPNFAFPMRDVERQFKIEMRREGERLDLGSVSYSQLLREAYPGAVYYYTTKWRDPLSSVRPL